MNKDDIKQLLLRGERITLECKEAQKSIPKSAWESSTFLSEISTFFKKNNAEGAMFTIMNVIKGIKMNEQTLFGRKSRCNSVYSLLHVFQLLLSQSNNFAAQIVAGTSLVALQYNVLSVVKRFMAYETIGELFRLANQDSHEITFSERIWGAILKLVAAITRIFSITDEEVLEAVVNESDELAHICELYKYKMVS